jgi:ribonuclease Z
MPKLIFLGTANAIPDEQHENTHMALVCRERLVLIDCSGQPTVRLQQAGLDLHALTDLVLTHFHPDHVSGVPSLLMNAWLLGRKAPLNIYGLDYTLERVRRMMDDYDWGSWPRFYPVNFITIPSIELSEVIDCPEARILASPVQHLVPNIGIRIELKPSGKVLAYSCDTQPCDEVVRLASGAEVLIHEATGAGIGHSSAGQAGQIARRAEVGRLLLIHYQVGGFDARPLIEQAQQNFGGPAGLAEDLMSLDF